jgi:hypothetical protein
MNKSQIETAIQQLKKKISFYQKKDCKISKEIVEQFYQELEYYKNLKEFLEKVKK